MQLRPPPERPAAASPPGGPRQRPGGAGSAARAGGLSRFEGRLAAGAVGWLRALLGTLLAGGSVGAVHAATLPPDQAEALFHSYDGGGVKANGPAFLVRKSLADRVSLSAQYYVDAVSNASIDVVTTASPFRETRHAVQLGAQTLVRDATISVSASSSREPDYIADAVNVDLTNEVFGGMTTVSLGYTRGHDQVGKKGLGWIDQALHWQYRAGVTQILTPTWLVSLNAEAIADSGYLGSPYRAARVFGAAVPERNPRTRSSRALELRSVVDTSAWVARSSLRASVRGYADNWQIRATTVELGGRKRLGERWLLDATLRAYRQSKALFYSDNASTQTLYLSRNRQLSDFNDTAVGARLNYDWPGLAPGHKLVLTASAERMQYRYRDFTDLRTGRPYAFDANVLQLYATATY